jgi:hypothetical protein
MFLAEETLWLTIIVVLSLQISFNYSILFLRFLYQQPTNSHQIVKSVDFYYRSGDRHSLFCPPESVIFSPKTVSYCFLNPMILSYHGAFSCGFYLFISGVFFTKFNVTLNRIRKRKASCGTIPILFLKSYKFNELISWSSIVIFRQSHHRREIKAKIVDFPDPVFQEWLMSRLSLRWKRCLKCLYICLFKCSWHFWMKWIRLWLIYLGFFFFSGSIFEFIQTFLWSFCWTMDDTQPNEATGQVSILTYKINSAIVPILLIVPSIYIKPPK